MQSSKNLLNSIAPDPKREKLEAEERKALREIVNGCLGGFAVAHPAAMGALQAIMRALAAREKAGE